jgi:Uma2 family endonuclease
VPESPEHDDNADNLRSVLSGWLERTGRPGAIRRNLAIRWDEANPRVGVDPDVCWIDALPPGWESGEIDSLRLWLDGHRVPPLAIEFVSRHHPYKDYRQVQDKYAVVGTQELWVYDARKFGPRSLGGPHLLQVWSRTLSGVLTRRHFSDAPARSPLLNAWLVPTLGEHLVIADDPDGQKPWPTLAGQERLRAEQERLRAEQERGRADELAAEVAKLRAELTRK